ncbi:MAG: serine protease [Methanobacteriota archaeon]|nr:MAG: serine protease [Euryarchaeota archaeon]
MRGINPKDNSLIGKLINSTVYVCSRNGSRFKTGTGFLLSENISDTQAQLFLVTNKHVIKNSNNIELTFRTLNKGNFEGFKISISANQFYLSREVDLAIANTVPFHRQFDQNNIQFLNKYIPLDYLASKTQLEALQALEEIYFIGYPNSIIDNYNLVPIIRKGITATPAYFDFNSQPLFLIDGSVIPGSSGSPVVIANQGSYTTEEGIVFGTRFMVLGILTIGFKQLPANSPLQPVSASFSEDQLVGLGAVIKSTEILKEIATIKSQLGFM